MEPSCPTLNDPKWGAVSVDYNNSVGHFVAKYTCDEGLVIRGDYQRYCLDDGKWTGREPFCLQGDIILLLYNTAHNLKYVHYNKHKLSEELGPHGAQIN